MPSSTPFPDVEVCCNRGVNGIEGSLSAAIGYATLSRRLNFVVIGDLSFFYDMNALWNQNYGANVRILLLNNEGGEIFHTLPGMDKTGRSREYITAEHYTTARGWAEERGFLYLAAKNQEQLDEAMLTFTQEVVGMQPILLEVFTDKETDTRLLHEYYHSLRVEN
jgi:2-succinyl-5-enolpyruvyl-6-hydroxy-3-cyclohexene-1-carboxylate synthase